MVTYLKPKFDSRKSFYNKAVVEIEDNKKNIVFIQCKNLFHN